MQIVGLFQYRITFLGIFAQSEAKVLTSPGFPGDYPPNLQEKYPLVVSEGKTMQISFTDFELEGSCSGNCTFDYVMITEDNHGDGDEDDIDLLMPRTCSNNIPPYITSKSNKAVVHFITDDEVELKGWRLLYSEV